MDKNQISQETHARVSSSANHKSRRARFLFLVLFLLLGLASLQPNASARAGAQSAQNEASTSLNERVTARNCPACEQALTLCIGSGGGGDCYVQYYACTASCQ